jgi:hypothetical protein
MLVAVQMTVKETESYNMILYHFGTTMSTECLFATKQTVHILSSPQGLRKYSAFVKALYEGQTQYMLPKKLSKTSYTQKKQFGSYLRQIHLWHQTKYIFGR